MGYLDFSRPDLPDFSEGIRRFGDDLTDVMNRRQQRELAQKKLDFEREQETRRMAQQKGQLDYQNAIEERKNRMAELQFNQQQNVYKTQRIEAARKAILDKNPQLADSIMKETALYDPHTGKEISRGSMNIGAPRDVGPAPEQPQLPEIPPETQLLPGMLRAIPGMGVPSQVIGGAVQGEQSDQAAKMRRYDAQMQAYSSDQTKAQDERPYSLGFGNEPPVTFDVATQRYASRKAAAQDFLESFRGVQMSPSDQAAAVQTAAQIQSGLDPTKAGAAYDKARFFGVAEEGKNTRNAATNAATIEAAKQRAKAFGMDWKETMARGNLALSAEREGNSEFKALIDRGGYKTDYATMKDLVDTRRSLDPRNPALDTAAGAAFARKVNGSGVLTDRDYANFWQKVGGVGVQAEDWFNRTLDGEMGDEKRDILIDAVAEKLDADVNRLRNTALQADKKFANEPWYPGTRAAYFGFVPNLPDMGEAAGPRIGTGGIPSSRRSTHLKVRGGGPPELDAKTKAKAKAALDEAMQ